MKKFYYLIFCTFVGITANAGQITEQQALQIAAKYADIDTKTYPQRMKAAGKQEKAAAYYAFNIGDNDGFVIVSGDDSLTELVGYSDSGSFDSDNIPDNMHSWLQTYSDYVASVQDGESKAKRQQLGKVTTVVVRPFVTTEWNQGEPYNRLTPILQGNTHCATGCVATAMAQVMKYYEWPERGTGSNKYQHSVFGTLSMDFSQSVYDWDNMLDIYSSYFDGSNNLVPEYNDEQAGAVAKLMYDCGISVNMNYWESSGASTSRITYAFENYFNYDSETFYRDNMTSEKFMTTLLAELDERRPALICGTGLGGAHAFVADGYDSNNFVHINWGWGGISDGYFNINYLDPDNLGTGGGSGAFKWTQTFTTAYPNRTGLTPEREQLRLDYMSQDDYAYGVFINNTDFSKNDRQTVSLSNVHNPNGEAYSGEISIAAFNENGAMTIIGTRSQFISGFPSGTYYPGETFNILSDFSSLEDGEYEICGISKEDAPGYDFDWVKFNSSLSIKIFVGNGRVTVFPTEYSLSLTKAIEKPERIYMNTTTVFTASFLNGSSAVADGTIDYAIKRLSDNYTVYSISVPAIIYDYNDYSDAVEIPIQSDVFSYDEEYSFIITGFTLKSGETIPIESTYEECTFTISEGAPQRQLSFYDNGDENIGISLNLDSYENSAYFPKKDRVLVTYTNIIHYYSSIWSGNISCALSNVDNEIMIVSDRHSSDLDFRINTYYSSIDLSLTPDISGLSDGIYSIIPVSMENGASDWVRFDHPSKIDIEIKDDYVYVRHYEYSLTQESEITATGNLTVDRMAAFNVEMRNRSNEDAVGDLAYEIRRQNDGSLAYEGTVRVGLPAYSTTEISIEQPLPEDIFSEGAYTIAITGYLSATHTDFSYSSAFQPSAFLIGTSGADAIEAANVTVYPNPAKDFITVDCGEGISSVTIFNASGQLVKSIGGADAEGSIHMGDLPAGYYIVAVGTESGTTVRKQILKH